MKNIMIEKQKIEIKRQRDPIALFRISRNII